MASCIRRRGADTGSGRRRWSLAITALAVVGSMVLAPAAPAKSRAAAAPVKGPWIAQDRDPAWRAQKLVEAMTLDEKLAMVHGTGLPLAGAGAGSIPANERLGIPALALSDGPLGPGNGATGVDAVALGDQPGVRRGTRSSSASGARRWAGSSGARAATWCSPRRPTSCGSRCGAARFETFSEDPFLTSQLAVAEIRGIQGQHVIATVKHFAANNQETLRGSIDVRVGERTQQEIYFPASRPPSRTARRRGDVLLQPAQRRLRLRERRAAGHRAAGHVELRGLRGLRLGRDAQHRQGRQRRTRRRDAQRPVLRRRAQGRRAVGRSPGVAP